MNLGATIVSLLLLDRVGRRPLLLLGIAGMGLSLTHLGYLFGVSNVPRNAILFDVIAYLASFAVGLGPIFWLLISEIYPTTVRGQAMSLSSVVIWLSDFPEFRGGSGSKSLILAVRGACLVALVFSARMVPETKGRTLEEIETSWTT